MRFNPDFDRWCPRTFLLDYFEELDQHIDDTYQVTGFLGYAVYPDEYEVMCEVDEIILGMIISSIEF